jgi:hypothetical protein
LSPSSTTAADSSSTEPQPLTVGLPAGATFSWVGPSPLIALVGGGVGVVHDAAVQPVALPAGATALAADGTTVVGVQGVSWVRSWLGSTPLARPLPRPAGVSGPPIRVEAVGANYLLAVWPRHDDHQPIALVDAVAGQLLAQTDVPPELDITHAKAVRQIDGALTAVGTVVVDPDLQQVDLYPSKYQVQALTPGHVTVSAAGHLNDIRLTRGGPLKVTPFSGEGTNALLATAERPDNTREALVVAATPAGSVLIGLEPTTSQPVSTHATAPAPEAATSPSPGCP